MTKANFSHARDPEIDEVDELADLYAEAVRRSPSFAAARADAEARHNFVTSLVKVRKQLRISQSTVAERMQTTQSAVSDLERGATDLYISTLQRYARALTARVTLQLELPADAPWIDAKFYKRHAGAVKIVPTAQKHVVNDPHGWRGSLAASSAASAPFAKTAAGKR
jgi:transcriptional regulator with XRE-family HTH domain